MASGVRGALAVLLALPMLSCAGGGGRSPIPDDWSVRYRADARGYRFAFDAPPDRIVEILPDVYGYLGFPGALATNSEDLVFISPTATAEGPIYEGERNSSYLDCGTGTARPRADTDVLRFAVVTRIVPLESGGSEIEVIVDGQARAKQRANNRNSIPCRGTGRLEGQVAALLRSKLAS